MDKQSWLFFSFPFYFCEQQPGEDVQEASTDASHDASKAMALPFQPQACTPAQNSLSTMNQRNSFRGGSFGV